ncbi:origin recognition complex [Salix suchowensis]|nr:origin recognition complex [Salix suchowensis]
MAPSATASDSLSPTTTSDTTENNFQPFFTLHRARSRKSEKKPTGTWKTRRRIDLSPSLPKNGENLDAEKAEAWDDYRHVNIRMEAFDDVWSKIKSTIKDINTNVFNDIHHWVRKSFNMITSFAIPTFPEATGSFPMVTDATSKQLFTGLVLTKNMEFVDDLLTFEELGSYLKSQGCHVANLSSLEFSVKNGIGGCLRSILRQFLMITLDAADVSILATWYREQGSCNNPVVIIIEDLERCCGSVLSDFIIMLRYAGSFFSSSHPPLLILFLVLIMGIATTLDAPKSILQSNALHHLCPCKFILGTPLERMDAIVEAVFHKVAVFMRNYFVSQDGTITSFIRALKIACAQHFFVEPLSFMLWFLLGDDNLMLQGEKYGLSPEMMLKHALSLPSCHDKIAKQHGETIVNGLAELKKLQCQWSIVILCLYEAGKCDKATLLDLFCEALDPDSFKSRAPDNGGGLENDSGGSRDCYKHQQYHTTRNSGFICQAVQKLRDLPAVQICKLLKGWEKYTVNVPQIHEKVKKLLSEVKSEDGKGSGQDLSTISKRHASRKHLKIEDSKAVNEKAAKLLESMVRNYMQPLECAAFHEIVCFKNVNALQTALIGDPRRRIQVDLLEVQNIIQCSCCSSSSNALLPSMHDSSILYTLAQEHGDLINLHDWYQSFKSVALRLSNKGKRGPNYSPSPKKRKATTKPAKPSEASIQARFCRAVTELQITGLLRMPSKRRPDYVQRVAFGL